MLGEQMYTSEGKRTARRVVETQPISVEVSFEDAGKLLGVDGMNIGTYTSTIRPDGTMGALGQGVFTTMDAQFVTWKGVGTGIFKPGGAVSYRGSVTFETSSSQFARVNAIAGVFEFEADAAGHTQTRIWEWK